MPINKISQSFGDDLQVEWPCPACGQKTINIIKESFTLKDTLYTTKNNDEYWFEPEMHSSVFCCMARCSRALCGEVVVCVGNSCWERDDDEEKYNNYIQWHTPVSFVPFLHPFSLPEECSEAISEPIKAAFSIYLTQPSCAANCIRTSVEKILTQLRNNQQCLCNIYCVFIQCDIMKAEKIFVCHNGRME